MIYPHQETGAAWLAQQRHAGLYDEMGLGKTITAIIAAKAAGCKRILVIAPSVVAFNWENELRIWAPALSVGVCIGVKGFFDTYARKPEVVIVTHTGIIQKLIYTELRKQQWDLIIVDEAHIFRNDTAQRTLALYGDEGITRYAERVWLLTGTPMPNHAAELWPMLRSLWPERCPYSYELFRDKFCVCVWDDFRHDYKVIGNKNVPELKALLAGTFLRRLKKDHLDLPPVRWETMVLASPGSAPELDRLDAEFRAALPDAKDEDFLDWIRGRSEFAAWRQLCGLAKVEPAAELLRGELEDTQHKVVVFAHHLNVIERLRAGLVEFNPVIFTGAVSAYERTQRVGLFQNAPRHRVALCQIQAAGVGITLTAASEVVLVEYPFVPAEVSQAVDRTHRIGQTAPVRARFLSLNRTVDQTAAEILARKTRNIAEILG